MKKEMAPASITMVPSQSKCAEMRANSQLIMRIHMARSGTSMRQVMVTLPLRFERGSSDETRPFSMRQHASSRHRG